MMTDETERDKNLMVVAATEGYAGRHNMPTYDAFAVLSKYGVTEAIRQHYNTLHTQSLDECVYFAEDMLKWKMENGKGACRFNNARSYGMETIKNKYVYNGDDLTTYIVFKIERIAAIIAEKEAVAFDAAYAKFLASKTYGILQKTDTLMWGENVEFIVDEYYREVAERAA